MLLSLNRLLQFQGYLTQISSFIPRIDEICYKKKGEKQFSRYIYVYTYLKYTYICIHIFNIYVYIYKLNSTNNFYDPWEPNQRKWLSHAKLWPLGSVQVRNVAQHKTISVFKTFCTGQSFINLRWTRVILEEGPSAEEIPSLVWPVGKSGGGIFSVISPGGPNVLWGVPPGTGSIGWYKGAANEPGS